MKQLIYVLLLQLTATIPLFSSDLTITYKVKARAMLVISSSATLVEYHSSHLKRVNNQKHQIDTIFDYNSFTKYSINHKKKTIRKITLDDVIKGLEMVTQAQNEAPEGTIISVRGYLGDINKTTDKKDGVEVILNRKCDKWAISLGNFTAKISVDPTLAPPIPQDGKVAELDNISTNSIKPGYADTLGRFFDLVAQKGIPLKSNVAIPIGPVTVKTSKEAIKIVEGAIPVSVFALPNGYILEDAGKEMLEKITEEIMTMPRSVVVGK